MMIDDAVFQVGEGEDKAAMFSKCKMSLAKQVSFALFTYLDSVLALGYDKVSANTAISVPKNSKFQSSHRVVKMVLKT